MAVGNDRQRRRRKNLAILGLLAALTAAALLFRATTGHYPWSAAPTQEADSTPTHPNLTNTPAEPPSRSSPTGAETPGAANQSPSLKPQASSLNPQAAGPTSAPATQASSPNPQAANPNPQAANTTATRPAVPTTLPAYNSPPTPNPTQAAADFKAGLEALDKNEPLSARRLLGQAYQLGLPPADIDRAIEKTAEAAKQTIFSPRPFKTDPLTEYVTVQPGDTLAKIAARYMVSEDLLAFVNNIKDKNIVRLGARLKVMRGPWHAVVHKSRHVMDIYLQDKYVRSFRVGLGVEGSTPTGLWRVLNHQEDPAWDDPRTGKHWHPADPANPIGDYWIGLTGLEGDAFGQSGYGIHGTIEPDSIGKDVSMGCIRLAPDDIALLYKLMAPGQSYIAVMK